MPTMQKLSHYRTDWNENRHGGWVIYAGTEIVRWDDNEQVTLNSNGWRSSTTKRKMVQASNQFGLGFTVNQKAGEWFVTRFGRSPEGYLSAFAEHGAVTFPYYDGISFPRGTVH